ncbi:hypothetical protein RB213_011990 [Colletotrichum asianum]
MYCNYGTDQVPQLNDCGNCMYPDWITEDPGLAAGFPVHRQCTTVTGTCTVTDSNGNVVKSKGGGDAPGISAKCQPEFAPRLCRSTALDAIRPRFLERKIWER